MSLSSGLIPLGASASGRETRASLAEGLVPLAASSAGGASYGGLDDDEYEKLLSGDTGATGAHHCDICVRWSPVTVAAECAVAIAGKRKSKRTKSKPRSSHRSSSADKVRCVTQCSAHSLAHSRRVR